MPAELTSLKEALVRFAFSDPAQSSGHLGSLRSYVACRLVIEGGFDPDWIRPRPPITVDRDQDGSFLSLDPDAAKRGRRTLPGGLKDAEPDVTVVIPTIGPVLALSLEGTESVAVGREGVPEITGGLERTAGACVNLHMIYPALVYGFWHVIGASQIQDLIPVAVPGPVGDPVDHGDHALRRNGELGAELQRYHDALARLSQREDIGAAPSRYEACALTLVERGTGPQQGVVCADYPPPGSPLDYNRMFQRLYAIYDRRFVDSTRALRRTTERKVWNRESPLLADTTVQDDLFAAMTPRVGGRDGVCPPLRPRNGGQRDDRTASITRDEIVARLDERHRSSSD